MTIRYTWLQCDIAAAYISSSSPSASISASKSSRLGAFPLLATASRTDTYMPRTVSSYIRTGDERLEEIVHTKFAVSCVMNSRVIWADLGPKAPSLLQWSNYEPDSNPNMSVSSYVRKFGVLCGLLRAVCKSYHRQRMRTSVTEAARPSAGRLMQATSGHSNAPHIVADLLHPLSPQKTSHTHVLDKSICFLPGRTGNRIAGDA